MTMKAGDCTTMDDIRANIDRIDADLMSLFSERWSFIRRAAEIKAERGLSADIPARVAEVRDNARRNAAAHGLDPDFYDRLWADLIQHAIAYEKGQLGED